MNRRQELTRRKGIEPVFRVYPYFGVLNPKNGRRVFARGLDLNKPWIGQTKKALK